MFVTTTCLDFAHLFARPELRTVVVKSILSDCIHYSARLYAYVVMKHHAHLVVQAPDGRTVSWLVQRIKTNSAKIITPLLTAEEKGELSAQAKLNDRRIWMRSFRGITIDREKMLDQKIAYVHENPIRAELCTNLVDYPWSSAKVSLNEAWDDSSGLATACLRDLEDRTLHTASVEGW